MIRAWVLLFVAVHVFGLATSAVAGSPGPFEALGLIRFDSEIKAPDFVLHDLNGQSISPYSTKDSATLLVFWGTW